MPYLATLLQCCLRYIVFFFSRLRMMAEALYEFKQKIGEAAVG